MRFGFFPSEDNKLSPGKSYRTLKVDYFNTKQPTQSNRVGLPNMQMPMAEKIVKNL